MGEHCIPVTLQEFLTYDRPFGREFVHGLVESWKRLVKRSWMSIWMVMILTKHWLTLPTKGQEIAEEQYERVQLYACTWIPCVFLKV